MASIFAKTICICKNVYKNDELLRYRNYISVSLLVYKRASLVESSLMLAR